MEEGDDGERQRRGEVGVGRWCEADRDGDGEWECEWNGCRNPIQSGFRWISLTMRFDANEKREEIPEATSIRGARWRL